MSYDINVTVGTWPADILLKWVTELKRMGVEAAFPPDFDPMAASGWCPVTVSVDDEAVIPLAKELREEGSFDSGFEYEATPDGAVFSSKASDGNAVAVWCAAALAAITGGTLTDPQCDLTARGGSGAGILSQLVEDRGFVEGFGGPKAPPKKKKAAAGPKVAKSTVVADLSKPVRPYSTSSKFEIAERVTHPSFGEGVVETSEPGKVTVVFAAGRRVLAQAKDGGNNFGAKGGGLDKPKPFDHANPSAGGKPVPQS